MTHNTGDRPARPDHVEPDPRTDGVDDSGRRDLPPPSEEDVDAARRTDEQVRDEATARGLVDDRLHGVRDHRVIG